MKKWRCLVCGRSWATHVRTSVGGSGPLHICAGACGSSHPCTAHCSPSSDSRGASELQSPVLCLCGRTRQRGLEEVLTACAGRRLGVDTILCVGVCIWMCACVRAYVRARMRVRVCVKECVFVCVFACTVCVYMREPTCP